MAERLKDFLSTMTLLMACQIEAEHKPINSLKRHSREGGNPVAARLNVDSRLRGNDGNFKWDSSDYDYH